MEDVNRRARKEAFIHSRRHMCLPYARDTLGGSRHDSRNGSESVENVLKHGDLLYFLPGLAFVEANTARPLLRKSLTLSLSRRALLSSC